MSKPVTEEIWSTGHKWDDDYWQTVCITTSLRPYLWSCN